MKQLSVDDIVSLLELCLKNTDFLYSNDVWHQNFGCAMGSPVSGVIANLVMENIETRIFQNDNFHVLRWCRYADDTWVVLPRAEVDSFFRFINSIEDSIDFTLEREDVNESIPFLDVRVSRHSNFKFGTSLYYKPSHTYQHLNFESHHPLSHKRSVVRSLVNRVNLLVSDECERVQEFQNVVRTLNVNGYPPRFIRETVGQQEIIRRISEPPSSRVVLPYVRGVSERISRILSKFNVRVSHKPLKKLCNFFPSLKDPVPFESTCGIVYEVSCSDCECVYVGQTKNSLKTRLNQHRAACRLFQPEKSALAEHAIDAGHRVNWSEPKILAKQSDWRKRLFLESWMTDIRHDTLNRCETVVPAGYRSLLAE